MIHTLIINLKRHTDRKKAMEYKIRNTCLKKYTFIEAVDGKTDLHLYNFKIMPNWIDPIDKQPINIGSIGCTLSHYKCWKYIIENKLEKALILEDDATFNDNFNYGLKYILQFKSDIYDFCYLNRVELNKIFDIEDDIELNELLVIPRYSYNTSSYIITYEGAHKMLNCNCLNYMLPIDELLPIMYDEKYPFKQYSCYFDKYTKLRAIAFKEDLCDQEHRDNYPSAIQGSEIYIDNKKKSNILYKGIDIHYFISYIN